MNEQKNYIKENSSKTEEGLEDLYNNVFPLHLKKKNFEDYTKALNLDFSSLLVSSFLTSPPEDQTSLKDDKSRDTDLSEYSITSEGLVSESWDTVENIVSRILEINGESIILECVIDKIKKVFENRKFSKSLIEGIIPLKQEYPIIIKIFKRPGEIRFKFIDGHNLIDNTVFEVDYTKNLPINRLNKKFK